MRKSPPDGLPPGVTLRKRNGTLVLEGSVQVATCTEPIVFAARFTDDMRRPTIYAPEAPQCLRHRFNDGSLCIWNARGSLSQRWVVGDGMPALVGHIETHFAREAHCRGGEAWPGPEAPGSHPRPPRCQTCGGFGP